MPSFGLSASGAKRSCASFASARPSEDSYPECIIFFPLRSRGMPTANAQGCVPIGRNLATRPIERFGDGWPVGTFRSEPLAMLPHHRHAPTRLGRCGIGNAAVRHNYIGQAPGGSVVVASVMPPCAICCSSSAFHCHILGVIWKNKQQS